LPYDGVMYVVGNDYNIVMNPSKKEHMSLAINDVSQEEKNGIFILTKRYSRKLNQNERCFYNKVVWERCFDNFFNNR